MSSLVMCRVRSPRVSKGYRAIIKPLLQLALPDGRASDTRLWRLPFRWRFIRVVRRRLIRIRGLGRNYFQLVHYFLDAVGLFRHALSFRFRLSSIDLTTQRDRTVNHVDINCSFRRLRVADQLRDYLGMNPGVVERLSDTLLIGFGAFAFLTRLLFTVAGRGCRRRGWLGSRRYVSRIGIRVHIGIRIHVGRRIVAGCKRQCRHENRSHPY